MAMIAMTMTLTEFRSWITDVPDYDDCPKDKIITCCYYDSKKFIRNDPEYEKWNVYVSCHSLHLSPSTFLFYHHCESSLHLFFIFSIRIRKLKKLSFHSTAQLRQDATLPLPVLLPNLHRLRLPLPDSKNQTQDSPHLRGY